MLKVHNTKSEDLNRLENFVKSPSIHGTWVCQLFLSLRKKYPLQFVWYMKKHRVIKDDPGKGDVVDSCYPHALKEVNALLCCPTKLPDTATPVRTGKAEV
jgi:hypothetical protein